MRIGSSMRRARVGVAAAAALALGACNDATTPGGGYEPTPLDAAQTTAQVQAVQSAFNTEAFRIFNAASPGIDAALGSAVGAQVTATFDAARADMPTLAEATGRMLARGDLAASAPSLAPIPAEYLGITFHMTEAGYQPMLDEYGAPVPGAPANGMRFILYLVDENGDIAVPLSPAGYIDITQLDEAGTAFHITTVLGEMTWMDIDFSRVGTPWDGHMGIVGWMATDETNRTEFDIQVTFVDTDHGRQLLVDAHTLVVASQVTMDLDATVNQTPWGHEGIELVMTLEGPGGRLDVSGGLLGLGRGGQFLVKWNGEDAAVMTLSGQQLTGVQVTGPEGGPLTQEQADAVALLYQTMEEGFVLVYQLTAPINVIYFPEFNELF